MSATVSVLIPCYNSERFVAETLESVLGQSWPSVEVIVVDDGSSDGSVDVVEAFASRGVRLIRQVNSGAAAARNRAMAASRGAFIQFLDADDIIDPDKIASQMARLGDRSGWIASAQWGRFHGRPGDTKFVPETNWRDLDAVNWLVESRRLGGGMLFPALWLIPREVAAAAGPWNEALSLNDDGEYFTRVVLASKGVAFCEDARCRYRSGISGSLSSSHNWQSGFTALDLCETHLRDREDSDRVRRAFALSWQHLAHGCYPHRPDLAKAALARARALHDVEILPDGGPAFRLLARTLGWKAARRLQVASGRP